MRPRASYGRMLTTDERQFQARVSSSLLCDDADDQVNASTRQVPPEPPFQRGTPRTTVAARSLMAARLRTFSMPYLPAPRIV